MENTYVEVFRYLFPGLLSVIILDSLIFREKHESYKYFFEAFIFTVISNSALNHIPSYWGISVYWASIILMPVLVAFNHNLGWTESLFINGEVTKKSSALNVWCDCFVKNKNFVRVHLKDNTIIIGNPETASEDYNEGLIYLTKAAWVDEEYNEIQEINAEGLLIHKSEIKYIYFLHSDKHYIQQKE